MGHFKKIADKEYANIEDSARVLAQAIVGDGTIYLHGFNEMKALEAEALYGYDRFPKTKPLFDESGQRASLSPIDRVIIATRFSNDHDALSLTKELQKEGTQVVALSAIDQSNEEALENVADFHVNTVLTKALIPLDDGSKVGFPSTMTALFAYYGLLLTTNEIIEEYED
jgi:hypothetical protein